MPSVALLLGFISLCLFCPSGAQVEEDRIWCDPILQCLELTPDWNSPTKPINVLPDQRSKINTGFILQTKEQPGLEENIYISADDLSTITTSTFDPARPTKFIIHGFMDHGDAKWMKEFSESLLGHGDYNVIRVNWGGGSMLDYIGASANIRVVGLEIAHLVNNLIGLYDLDPTTVHIIGHSLGAHAAGHAGEGIANMGRISGMDPAGPGFTDTATFVRLDPTDANFVDNIHSDADTIFLLGYGTKQPMGHVDFYPNGGHDQPGCEVFGWLDFWNWVNGPRDIVACNHQRAVNFFEETLKGNDCQWLAHECSDYDSFKKGLCTSCGADDSACAYLGIKADQYATPERESVQLYIDTSDVPNFCRVHYVLEVLTDLTNDAEPTVYGNLRIKLYGANGGIYQSGSITDTHEKINHGELLRFMFLVEETIGDTLNVELEWRYNDTIFPETYCNVLFCDRSLYVKSIQLVPGSVAPESIREATTFLGCDTNGDTTKMTDRDVYTFMQRDACAAVA